MPTRERRQKNLLKPSASPEMCWWKPIKLGFSQIELEASLAIGEIQLRGKNPALGRKRLEETEKNARSKGFELIARKASSARQAALN
jgi:hypothetical protein